MEQEFPKEIFQTGKKDTLSKIPFSFGNFIWKFPKSGVPFIFKPELPKFPCKW
jgi:hypothetical protein